jgi:hypothetical protein
MMWAYSKLYTAKILETNCFVFKIVLRYRGKNRGQFHEAVVRQAPSVFSNVYFVYSYVSQWFAKPS